MKQLLPDLPIVSQGDDAGLSGAYGADSVAAAYCGFAAPPQPISGIWNQRWMPAYRALHPDFIAQNHSGIRKDQTYWVARQDQVDYLRAQGFDNARAIGLPLIYLPSSTVRREAGTLLVLPPRVPPSDCRGYVEEIDSIRPHFRKVAICIDPRSPAHGLWVEEFEKGGYELIEGFARTEAPTAWHGLQAIFSQYEYVTANGYRSHLAYAAYFGAKVSIFGRVAAHRPEDFADRPLFRQDPEIGRRACEEISEAGMRRHHPDFFTPPQEAPLRVEWARKELGEDCKIAPSEMRRLFKWTLPDRLGFKFQRAGQRVFRNLPPRIRTHLRRRWDLPFRLREDAVAQLYRLPPFTPGETGLIGVPFRFADAPSFLYTYDELFRKQIYRFVSATPAPRIVDCGANIGLSVLYFKSLYPGARVTAFEPDPAVFRILQQNCTRLGLADVELHHAAVWTGEGTLSFRQQGGDSGRLSRSDEGRDVVKVRTAPLKDFLQEPVDFLKVDIEGAEIEVLESCAEQLKNVAHLFVEHHSYLGRPQHLDRLMATLTRAGFRLHIETFQPSPQPLLFRNIRVGIDSLDMNLNIFGFRP